MDTTKLAFLKAILGEEGACALEKAVQRYEPLENVLIPRAVLSWLSVAARTGYEGNIPGVPDAQLSFAKSEDGLYAGLLSVNGASHPFENASVLHVVAGVAVALNADLSADHGVKDSDIVNLGRQVDLLVKAEFMTRLPEMTKKEDPVVLPKPQVVARQKPRIPKPKTMRLTKSQASAKCPECGQALIENERFVGCACTSELAHYAKLQKNEAGYTVQFGREWGEDELSLFISIIGAAHG